MPKKKILIVTVPLGGGHEATARTLADYFASECGDQVDIELVDIFKDIKVVLPIESFTRPAYQSGVKYFKGYPYKWFFNVSDAQVGQLNKLILSIGKVKLPEYLKKKDPDLIVSTYPINYAMTHVLKKWPKKVPVVSVITDTGAVHKLWLSGGEDLLLTPSKDTEKYLLRHGITKDRVTTLGFPVDARFFSLPPKAEARRKLGLAPDKPTILFNAGGLGLATKVLKIARLLAERHIDAQYIFVAGRNPRLTQALKQIEFATNALIFGYVDNMPDLMAAADLVVGKAGWISLTEAMAARRPTIIIDIVPGQEEPNAQLVKRSGVGIIRREPASAVEEIEEHVLHPEKLEWYEAKFARLPVAVDAGPAIAKFLAAKYL